MDLETRRKISKAMKGKSNFEGKRHTHATKIQIGISQEGHRNAKDHKWVTDKETGQEHRIKGRLPGGMRWGRSPSSFAENFMDGRNPEDKGDMARHGLKDKTVAQLKKVRASDKATPRQKQLAHWYINMHKEEKQVWEKPNPVSKSEKLSAGAKAKAKARAKAAGRPYPNMVDNIWAARNEETMEKVTEAKATPCGRCGTTHVPPKFGGKCPAVKEARDNALNTVLKSAREINELKKTTLGSYVNNASMDAARTGNTLGRLQASKSKLAGPVGDKLGKRLEGIKKAVGKLQK